MNESEPLDPDELFGPDEQLDAQGDWHQGSAVADHEARLDAQAESGVPLDGFEPDNADEESQAEDLAHMVALMEDAQSKSAGLDDESANGAGPFLTNEIGH